MVKKQNNNKRISPSMVAIIGALITITGGFFLSYNYVETKKVVAYDYMASVFDDSITTEVNITETDGEQRDTEEDLGEVTNNYIGYLSIPKINLNKGFLDKRSENNDVEKNILVVDGSSYPDVNKGNLIIAGHSGTGWKAFFNDLYKLTTGDEATISYKGTKYIYRIVNIYKQPKIGKIAIYRNYEKTTLTLITCTNNDSQTQTIYIAELESTIEE